MTNQPMSKSYRQMAGVKPDDKPIYVITIFAGLDGHYCEIKDDTGKSLNEIVAVNMDFIAEAICDELLDPDYVPESDDDETEDDL